MLTPPRTMVILVLVAPLVAGVGSPPGWAGGGGGTVQCADPGNPHCVVDASTPAQPATGNRPSKL